MFTSRKAGTLAKTRERLPWPADRTFKILSLDGGGIRGIYPSHFLKLCEDAFGPVSRHFDLIAGTSTGGIIALGIGLGLDAEKIDRLYIERGSEVFPPGHLMKVLKWMRWAVRPTHDHKALEKQLTSTFGQRLFGESANRLVIPAFVGPEPQIAIFKTDHHPDYRRDWEAEAWRVARATSAAPTFFHGQQEDGGFFLDGGVWANNPILCAIAEALSAYAISRHQIRILSLGTGSNAKPISERLVRAGALGWRGIINTAMFLTSDSALSQARLILGFDQIVRVEPGFPRGAVMELDDWRRSRDELPAMAEIDFTSIRESIAGFFHEDVEPRERFYS